MDDEFTIGERVYALWDKDDWRPGRITSWIETGVWSVLFDCAKPRIAKLRWDNQIRRLHPLEHLAEEAL